MSRRPTAAGQAVLDRWHAAAGEAHRGEGARRGDARLAAFAAALGRTPGAVAAFAPPGPNTAWSSYRGRWRQIVIETNTNAMSCQASLAILLAVVGGPPPAVFVAI